MFLRDEKSDFLVKKKSDMWHVFVSNLHIFVLFNKTDLFDEEKKRYFEYSLEKYDHFLKKLEKRI